MRSFDVGQRFLRYYQDNGFQVLPRGSLLDPSVPTTFVGSAGLIQIESAIEQGEDRADERYVLSQTCFRHFDLEKVGQSPFHLSLFEMPGAFSFGQEKKEDALSKIWGFLTGELGLHGERIWATYFIGGELDGHKFEEDIETARAWRKIGLSPSQIVGVGIDVGFWAQGDGIVGKEYLHKCGPTTELFFDRGSEWCCGAACQPGCRCGRFIEIANVLFIDAQIDQVTQSLNPLVTPFTETVIGAERVTMSLLGLSSVFDIECLAPLIKLVRSCHQATDSPSPDRVRSEQVIADHLRALLFLVTDGAPEPNKRQGQTRIIRTLIRRIRTHQEILGITEASFIPDLLDATLNICQDQHLDLEKGRESALTYYSMENERFESTLSRGYRCLDQFIQQRGNGAISGKQGLYLVKRKGFPLTLIEATLVQKGIGFNKREYWDEYAKEQRNPRKYWKEHERSVRP